MRAEKRYDGVPARGTSEDNCGPGEGPVRSVRKSEFQTDWKLQWSNAVFFTLYGPENTNSKEFRVHAVAVGTTQSSDPATVSSAGVSVFAGEVPSSSFRRK